MTQSTGACLMKHQPVGLRSLPADNAPMTYTDEFTSWLTANNCGTRTVNDRLRHVANFQQNHPSFPAVTPGEVTNWIGRPDYAQWSRATYFCHLRSFYRFAAQSGMVQVDPMAGLRKPRAGRCVPRPLTPGEVARVMLAANPNVRAWLMLGLLAGLRAFEIAKIRGGAANVDASRVAELHDGLPPGRSGRAP